MVPTLTAPSTYEIKHSTAPTLMPTWTWEGDSERTSHVNVKNIHIPFLFLFSYHQDMSTITRILHHSHEWWCTLSALPCKSIQANQFKFVQMGKKNQTNSNLNNIALFRTVTMFSGTNDIPWNITGHSMYPVWIWGIFHGIISIPHNIVMDLNNVMKTDHLRECVNP